MSHAYLYETSRETGTRLSKLDLSERQAQENAHPLARIHINGDQCGSAIIGFGGAITEASAYVLSQLNQDARQAVLDAYFAPNKGIGYTLARTHLNSCDFSLGNWSCLEEPNDTELKSFSMTYPDRYLTKLLQDANTTAKQPLALMLSPWSPPAWMKTNKSMNRGGSLLPIHYPSYAQLFVRYIEALVERGLEVHTVSVQNEPAAVQSWDSCIWSATDEARFAVEHLGPALKKAGFGHIKILIWDHNRDLLAQRANESMSFPGAEDYIAGFAFHWYSGDQYENLATVQKQWPNKMLVFSEGCVEGGPRPGAWFTGERYAHNIINDLNNGCQAWLDWNLALDTKGGPNHVGNYCDAPVLVDTETASFTFQSSFYYLGQFSKCILPGARRLKNTLETGMLPASPDGRAGTMVESCTFQNPDGSLAIIICNRTEANLPYKIEGPALKRNSYPEYFINCPPRSIQSVILE